MCWCPDAAELVGEVGCWSRGPDAVPARTRVTCSCRADVGGKGWGRLPFAAGPWSLATLPSWHLPQCPPPANCKVRFFNVTTSYFLTCYHRKLSFLAVIYEIREIIITSVDISFSMWCEERWSVPWTVSSSCVTGAVRSKARGLLCASVGFRLRAAHSTAHSSARTSETHPPCQPCLYAPWPGLAKYVLDNN